jgi:hemoglobin-like flavoprotein
MPEPVEDVMTPAQVACVQRSFAQLRPRADPVAARFYQYLFILDPSVRPLFPDDLTAQGRKLMDMLGLVVHGLPRLDTIRPVVQALGRRHVQYGVHPEHYKTVGAALLWTLEQELGPTWTPEVREAWATAYTALAAIMTTAAGEVPRPVPPRPAGHESLRHQK